jgi:general secretion pathway protein A
MYKKFFSLKEKPFKLVPDPEYYYLSNSHEEAMAHLTYAISQGDGFVEITGEVGTGKTMMCRVFLDNLDDKTEAAYIFNPKLGPKQLLKAINDEFGIPSAEDDTKELIDALNVYLMEKKSEGKKVILLIDEAQNLAKNVLEQLRLLSNLETSKFKLLQIILVGQPELGEMLDSHELRQLGQRITLSCNLFPLTSKEIREYIDHRIHIASSKSSIHFTRAACRLIYKYSAGIPRLINILCDRALLTAFSRNQKRITGHITRIAIRELTGRRDAGRIGFKGISKPAAIFAFASLALLLFFSYYHKSFNPLAVFTKITYQHPQNYPPDPAALEASVSPTASLKARKKKLSTDGAAEDLLNFLQDMDVRKARQLALESVLDRWGTEAVITPEIEALTDNYAFFRQAAEQSGLSVIRVACNFNLIKTLDLPAILEIKLPDYPAPGYLTIRKIDDRQITLSRARTNQLISVNLDIIEPYCTGSVYIPWKNFLVYKGAIPRTIPHESIIVLKMHLHDIGFNQIDLNPYYDDQTELAVKQIQQAYGLDPDGIVGPLTKIVLFNEKKSLKIPHIAYNQIDPH